MHLCSCFHKFKCVGKCTIPFDKEHRTDQTFDNAENRRQKRHRHVSSQHVTPQMRYSAEAGGGHFLLGPCTTPTEHRTSQSNSLYVPLPLMGVVTPGPPAEESHRRDTSSVFFVFVKAKWTCRIVQRGMVVSAVRVRRKKAKTRLGSHCLFDQCRSPHNKCQHRLGTVRTLQRRLRNKDLHH